MVGAHDDRGVVPQRVLVDRVDQAAEPRVDHRELGAVVGAEVTRLAFGQPGLLAGCAHTAAR